MSKKAEMMQPITIEEELKTNHFRVVVFGSARIKREDERYILTYELARQIAKHDIDIVTGGGPGIMEAANAGHHAGRNGNYCHSIGITVKLPFEENVNAHLDLRKHFTRFSNRLDQFMVLSDVVVVMPGGVGTCLEFFYTWQLTQVKHICKIPIILMGEMWEGMYQWIQDQPLKKGFISPADTDNISIAKTAEEALAIILQEKLNHDREGQSCATTRKYLYNDSLVIPNDPL